MYHYICIYIYIYTHTYIHIHTYIYIKYTLLYSRSRDGRVHTPLSLTPLSHFSFSLHFSTSLSLSLSFSISLPYITFTSGSLRKKDDTRSWCVRIGKRNFVFALDDIFFFFFSNVSAHTTHLFYAIYLLIFLFIALPSFFPSCLSFFPSFLPSFSTFRFLILSVSCTSLRRKREGGF